MKVNVNVIKTVLCICAAFGWWGILYPELTMMPDTYRVVREERLSPEEGISSEESALPEEGTSREERISQKEQACAENVCDSAAGKTADEAEEWDFDRDIYFEILQAPKEQVHFKSRLLMSLKEIF